MPPQLYFFFSIGVLELLLGKSGLPQRLCHLWVTAPVSVLQVLVDHGQEGLRPVPLPVWRSVCLIDRWETLLLGPLAYGAGSHDSHRGTSVWGWMPTFCCGGGDNTRNILRCCDAGIILPMNLPLLSLYFIAQLQVTAQCHFPSP